MKLASMSADTLDPALLKARLRAGRVLRLEAGWPRLLPALAALCGFAVLALLSLPQRLPIWLHIPVLLLLAAFIARAVWQATKRVGHPSGDSIDRRVEQRSGLRHRPLQMLLDQPAGGRGDPAQIAIWQAHRERTLTQLKRLRAGPPRLGFWNHAAGRYVLALLPLLLLAALFAGTALPTRLASGFLPGLFELPGPAPQMQAWITPPDYARIAPVFLINARGETTVPSGSVLQISLTGMRGVPVLAMHDLDAAHRPSAEKPGFKRLSAGSWSLVGPLNGSTSLSLRGNGRVLANWTIHVTPLPPTLVAWDGTPGPASEPWRTRLPWRVSNPYGLNSLTAEIRLADPKLSPGAAGLPALDVPIVLAPGTHDAHGVTAIDLSADPRAGEPVIARLVATDASGRITQGAEARFTLPARNFRNPLARAVLDTRKRLALGREDRAAAASDLQALGEAPGQFLDDPSLFLNLSSIASLLQLDDVDNVSAIREATGSLWELALALEDGLHNDRPGARAAADVRAAREAVTAQLDRMRQLGEKGQLNKEQSELERRIQALTAAIARRMQTLAEQARREHSVLPPMPDAKTLGSDDLARMMQQMRNEAAQGKTQEAMQHLAQMQAMLDRMRAATPQDLQSAQRQAEAQRQVREQMAGLQDLVKRQSTLLDQTQARRNAEDKQNLRQDQAATSDAQTRELLSRLGIQPPPDETAPSDSQAGAAPPPPSASADPDDVKQRKAEDGKRDTQRHQDARIQHSLARALDELGQEFKGLTGTQPGGFDDAKKAMGKARTALATGHDQPAQDAQLQALAALQKGAQQMRKTLSSGKGGTTVLMPGTGDESGSQPGQRPGEDADGTPGQDPGKNPGHEPGQDEANGEPDGKNGPHDPLGRPVAGGQHADDGDTHVPDKAEQLRARDIEQELRRRDTDRTRAPDELHYLDRLLKPF